MVMTIVLVILFSNQKFSFQKQNLLCMRTQNFFDIIMTQNGAAQSDLTTLFTRCMFLLLYQPGSKYKTRNFLIWIFVVVAI